MNRYRTIIAGAGLAALLSLSSVGTVASPRHTGIQGSCAMIYTPPGMFVDGFYVVPLGFFWADAQTSLEIYSARSQRLVARVMTEGPHASYRVVLPPGEYVVAPAPFVLGPDCVIFGQPTRVTVRARQFTTLDVRYYTSSECAQSYFAVGAPISP